LKQAAFYQRAEDSRKNGFESQKQREADQARKQELHEARIRHLNSQAENKELDTDIRGGIEAPLPGHLRIPHDTLKHSLKETFREVANAARAASGELRKGSTSPLACGPPKLIETQSRNRTLTGRRGVFIN
jgi:hypothetical protein